MAWIKNVGELIDAIDDFRLELDHVKEDMLRFKKKTETDLDKIRNDFKELIIFLQESAEEEEQEQERAKAAVDPVQTQLAEDIKRIGDDMTAMRKDLADILGWKADIDSEFKAVHEALQDSRKDMRNKISYAVSQLKKY